jgi:hypothetical protein
MTELELQEAFMNDFKELLVKYGAYFIIGYEEVAPFVQVHIPSFYDYEKDELVRPYACIELPTLINPN